MRRQREREQREEKDATKHWHPPALSRRRQGGERRVQAPGEPAATSISSDFQSFPLPCLLLLDHALSLGVGMARPLTRIEDRSSIFKACCWLRSFFVYKLSFASQKPSKAGIFNIFPSLKDGFNTVHFNTYLLSIYFAYRIGVRFKK